MNTRTPHIPTVVANNPATQMRHTAVLLMLVMINLSLLGQRRVYLNQPYTMIDNQLFLPISSINDDKSFMELVDLADSILYYDEYDALRKLFPRDLASKYFDLPYSQDILIHDRLNNQLAQASFKQIEYYEDLLEGQFIANYTLKNKLSIDLDSVYTINEGSVLDFDKDLQVEGLDSFALPETKTLKETYYLWFEDFIRYTSLTDTANLTMISYEKTIRGDENRSFESAGYNKISSQVDQILLYPGDFILIQTFVIPLMKNGKPILLFRVGVPESSFIDCLVLSWDGDKYIFEDKSLNY